MNIDTLWRKLRTIADEKMGARLEQSANGLSTQIDRAAKEVITSLVPTHQIAKGVTGRDTVNFPAVDLRIPFLNGHGTIPIAKEITIASSSYEEDFTGRVRKAITLATCFQINTGLGLISMCNLLKTNTEGKQTGFLAVGFFILFNRVVKLAKNVLQFNFMKNLENLNIFPFLQLLMEYQKYKVAQYIAGKSIQLHDHPDISIVSKVVPDYGRLVLDGNNVILENYLVEHRKMSKGEAWEFLKTSLESMDNAAYEIKLKQLYEIVFLSFPSCLPETCDYANRYLNEAENLLLEPTTYTSIQTIHRLGEPPNRERLLSIKGELNRNISIIEDWLKTSAEDESRYKAYALKAHNKRVLNALPLNALQEDEEEWALPIVPKQLATKLKNSINNTSDSVLDKDILYNAICTVYSKNFPAVLSVLKSDKNEVELSREMIQVLKREYPEFGFTCAKDHDGFKGTFEEYIKISQTFNEDSCSILNELRIHESRAGSIELKRTALIALYMQSNKDIAALKTATLEDLNTMIEKLQTEYKEYNASHSRTTQIMHAYSKNKNYLFILLFMLSPKYLYSFLVAILPLIPSKAIVITTMGVKFIEDCRKPLTDEQKRRLIQSPD